MSDRDAERAGDVGAAERDAAERRMNRHASVRVPLRERRVRLERHVLDHLRPEAAFEDAIRLGKPLLDVALLNQLVTVDVRARRVHAGRFELQRFERIEHRRKLLVLNLDRRDRVRRDLLRHGGDRRDAVAGVEDMLISEHRLILQRRTERVARDVLAGDDRHDAWHRFGFLRVDADDPRASHAGPLDLRVEHAGQVEVVDVLRLAEAMGASIGTRRPLTDRGRLAPRLGNPHFEREGHERRGRGRAQQFFRVEQCARLVDDGCLGVHRCLYLAGREAPPYTVAFAISWIASIILL